MELNMVVLDLVLDLLEVSPLRALLHLDPILPSLLLLLRIHLRRGIIKSDDLVLLGLSSLRPDHMDPTSVLALVQVEIAISVFRLPLLIVPLEVLR
jgi:hypothetical protein